MGNCASAPLAVCYEDLSAEDKQRYEAAYVASLKTLLSKLSQEDMAKWATGFELVVEAGRRHDHRDFRGFYTPWPSPSVERAVFEPLSNILARLQTVLPRPYVVLVESRLGRLPNPFHYALKILFVQPGAA